MNIVDFEGIQLWIGQGCCGYEIVLRLEAPCEHPFGSYLIINENGVFDGDYAPANIDDSYRKITPEDYENILNTVHKYGEMMENLAKATGQRLDRKIMKGDCLYLWGNFYNVIDISEISGIHYVTAISYDYSLSELYFDESISELEKMWDADLNEILTHFRSIPIETYQTALNLAKSAIIEITDYIERLYKSKS